MTWERLLALADLVGVIGLAVLFVRLRRRQTALRDLLYELLQLLKG